MFSEIYRFELRYQLRQPLFWVAAFFFCLLTFFAVTTDAVMIGGAIGKVNRNAPFVILQLLATMSLLGIFVTTAFVANTVIRDAEHKTQEVFFSTPMGRRDFLLGRFGGAITAAFLLFGLVSLAILVGSWMPWLEAERVGPFMWEAYATALLYVVLPNTFLIGAIFFALATWTRSMVATYVGVVAVLVGYIVSGNMLGDAENDTLASLLDPFGMGALGIATRYWTVAERNTRVLELAGTFLQNRMLWTGVAVALVGFAYWRFSFNVVESRKARRWRRKRETVQAVEDRAVRPIELGAPVRTDFSAGTRLAQLWTQTRFEIGGVLKSLAFPVILAFGVLNMIGNANAIDQMFGTPVYPVTNVLVRVMQGGFLFVFVVLTFYSGEIVWRARELRSDEVLDALPVPTWVLWSSKLAALSVILLSLMATATLTGIGYQAWHGFYDFEPALYLKGFFGMVGVPLVLVGVLAIFVQVATNQKFAGFLVMILYFISGPALQALDYDHNLYNYANGPAAPYSDMNGFGHFVEPTVWFYLYWTFCAAILVVLVHLLWVRGKETALRHRLRIARLRLTPPVVAALVTSTAAFAATGGWIFYNTNVLNEYRPDDKVEARRAAHEKAYKALEGVPQPKITAVYADVDIYPYERRADIRGRYTLVNKTGEAITELHVSFNPDWAPKGMQIPGAALDRDDPELGYRSYRFGEPLAPGEERVMEFEVGIENPGFVNNGSNIHFVYNGTFFNSFDYFPHIGYNGNAELQDPNDRREHGLEPIVRMPKLEDEDARWSNALSSEADWADFETVVSTSPDQIALAPGYLQKEWVEGDRRYFHYKMDAPILAFWAYLSADWEVKKDRWNDVALEVYYDRHHPYNVDRMIDAMKASLDYYSREFGPYQFRQMRILEFPRYATFAQSFPNTVPFSESIGFIARLDETEEDAIDYVFYVTAHEMAHQWWAHQVISGNVQGSTMLMETMSQYSALMVMEHEYGPEKMRRFLKYELDNYLRNRGGELVEELPLLRVEDQPYIHYRKGSVVMYALKDALGEERLNRVIRGYVADTRFQEPPYTTTREFVDRLLEETPPEQQAFVKDLIEDIVLFENKATRAEYTVLDDGRYEVTLEVESQKLRADGLGAETEVPVDSWVDIGVFGAKEEGGSSEGRLLRMEKHRITEPTTELTLVVDEEPVRAGIDPYHKLVDRNPENNLTRVTAAGS